MTWFQPHYPFDCRPGGVAFINVYERKDGPPVLGAQFRTREQAIVRGDFVKRCGTRGPIYRLKVTRK